jgi:DNA (cytosine-5)-methyltransferase 1
MAGADSTRRSIIPQCDGEPNAGREIQSRPDLVGRCVANSMAGAEGERLQRRPDDGDEGRRQRASGQGCEAGELGRGPTNGFWRDADWIGCTDGKWRPVMPESFPLASRTAFDLGSGGAFENKSRAKMLKGYGNAIVGELAAEFIMAAMS